MNSHKFDAVIFDLDGVITQTALVHGHAWKEMFDNYLKGREEKYGEPFKPFTHADDYLPYVDGKPRYKGVADFLASRNIDIPYGDPGDPPEKETVCGLGNQKNVAFNEVLKRDGVKVYDSTFQLIKNLRSEGIKVGVASSSKNCKPVLEVAGLIELFDTRVDGVVSIELNLKGKPEPDIFTTACDNVGVTYDKAVIVEDAVSGVQAGKNGNFGLTLGIAREENVSELYANGADIVVTDIEELGGIDAINHWFTEGVEKDNWTLKYLDYNEGKENTRESLLAVGNGYFATRGALEETKASDMNYPGTYMAGLYNKLDSEVSGKTITNEDFVNCPNWLITSFKINDNPWIDLNEVEIVSISRYLSLQEGVLYKEMTIRDDQGNETLISSKRFVSMANSHTGAMQYSMTPLNYSAKVQLRTGLDGNLQNAGVKRYQQLNQDHLKPLSNREQDDKISLLVETTTTGTQIATVAKVHALADNTEVNYYHETIGDGEVYTYLEANLEKNEKLGFEKVLSIYTSKADDVDDPMNSAWNDVSVSQDFDELLEESRKEWDSYWKDMDMLIEGDRYAQKIIRIHIYHLLVTASKNSVKYDFGIPPRGLHGEAYRGHIFWDELYLLPFYFMHLPDVARSCLEYRYKRLDAARQNARENGYEGAMFPWQSGSDGSEESQVIHLNPVSGEWDPDYSSLQRHISIAIAYNIWGYIHYTNDYQYLKEQGAELFLDICKFWVSKAEYDASDQRYHIDRVMGPDEFHEKYPDADHGGLKDNAYTNIMVVWLLNRAFEYINYLKEENNKAILSRLELDDEVLNKWKDIASKMSIPVSDEGIIAQFEGYFDLKEVDWDVYKEKYEDIHRMDRVLKAEGESPDEFKVSKQADLLMAYYLLDPEDVDALIKDLGYHLPAHYLKKNYDYYLKRTSHGSTLSRVVHAYLANSLGDKTLAWKFYMEALGSDINDIQGGTTGEGIHVGVMGGTILEVLTAFAGIRFNKEVLDVYPNIPEMWKKVAFNFYFKENYYTFELSSGKLKVFVESVDNKKVKINVKGNNLEIEPLVWNEFDV